MQSPVPILVNPAAVGGRPLKAAPGVSAVLATAGIPSEIVVSRGPGHRAEAAAGAAAAGCAWLVALGGDGTLSEVAGGLLEEGSGRTAMAPVPAGTGNDFAKTAGVPSHWKAAARRLTGGARRRQIDAGRLDGRWFINGVGMGLDAAVAVGADRHKRRAGVLGYLAGFAGVLRDGVAAPMARIRWDGGQDERRVSLVTVCNGRHVGGLFHIAPDAALDDGCLNLVWADRVNRRQVLRYAPRVISGSHLSLAVAHTALVTRVEIELDGPLPVQADGEIISTGLSRLSVEIAPGALALLC
ncbi:MAG: diacylglycerol kinase family protein [Gammaproteobacteria bacterium]